MTRKYIVFANEVSNSVLIILVCIREFCSETTGQGFYSAAIMYIYPFEYMLTVSYKLLPFTDNICNWRCNANSALLLFFFQFLKNILSQIVMNFPLPSYLFYICSYILMCMYVIRYTHSSADTWCHSFICFTHFGNTVTEFHYIAFCDIFCEYSLPVPHRPICLLKRGATEKNRRKMNLCWHRAFIHVYNFLILFSLTAYAKLVYFLIFSHWIQ